MTEHPPEHIPTDATASGRHERARTSVAAVIPAWNRPADLVRIMTDLAAIDCDADIRVIVVDNNSDVALEPLEAVAAATRSLHEHHAVEFLRLAENRGGSGGFNAGIAHALGHDPGLVWLIDSDARVEPGCLSAMLDAMDDSTAAVGAAIGDPATGKIFEVGGRLNRRTGRIEAAMPDRDRLREPFAADYAAACCLLVRAEAVRKAGLMPDLFLHSDDVSFCLRLSSATGQRIVAAPQARCRHPRFDRYKTWARYYEARNWIVPAVDAKLNVRARFRRAWREVVLAVGQTLICRDDLAKLHVRGLADAAGGNTTGRADAERILCARTWPMHSLGRALDAIAPTLPESAQPIAAVHMDAPLTKDARAKIGAHLERKGLTVVDTPGKPARSSGEALRGLLRTILTPPAVLAVVNAKAPPHAWSAGRVVLAVSPFGYTLRRMHYLERIAALLNVVVRGSVAATRLALLPPAAPASPSATPRPAPADRRPTLSIIILTRDRVEQLLHTLTKLREGDVGRDCEIVVVDNDSRDGTPATIRARFSDVVVVETGDNLGVEGFNRGVAASSGEAVLILDDDAWPAKGTLAGALDRLKAEPDLDAIMLHRRHPKTDEWEWPFAHELSDDSTWPDMGSGNIIRRDAWDAVGGYESGYFLYRNDTDLALKLLAAGKRVAFARDLHVWHDSPIAKRKTPKWIWRSTRNWVWLCRRHGRRGSGLRGILLGWLWAHRLARLSPAGHVMALRGLFEGLLQPAPALEDSVRPD
ncbi:MAG: glycosyltransferase, partial [Planctomycetota bacterium]